MKEELWSYVAGLIDGDGHLILSKNRNSIAIRIGIANTSLEIMHFLQREFGGFIREDKLRADRQKQRKMYYWNISKFSRVSYFLKKILPYLIIKKEQAKLILKFANSRVANLNRSYSYQELEWFKEYNQRYKRKDSRTKSESL